MRILVECAQNVPDCGHCQVPDGHLCVATTSDSHLRFRRCSLTCWIYAPTHTFSRILQVQGFGFYRCSWLEQVSHGRARGAVSLLEGRCGCSRMLAELGLRVARGVLEAARSGGAGGAAPESPLHRVPGDVPLPHSFYSNAAGACCRLESPS